jgi:spore coat polysaccharide biosynthesis protein SpsF
VSEADTGSLKVVATIEARMTSSRLPGKVLMPAADKPMLQILVERLRAARGIDEIVIATTVNATDDPIEQLARRLDVAVFRGSENDVLDRVCAALRVAGADVCVEITGDCPLIDPGLVEEALAEFHATRDSAWYISNSDPHRAVPAGLDVQVFWASKLYELDASTRDPDNREHVSYGFYRPDAGDRWRPRFITHDAARGGTDVLVTLDYLEDYELIRALYEDLAPRGEIFGVAEIIRWVRRHPERHARCARVRGIAA